MLLAVSDAYSTDGHPVTMALKIVLLADPTGFLLRWLRWFEKHTAWFTESLGLHSAAFQCFQQFHYLSLDFIFFTVQKTRTISHLLLLVYNDGWHAWKSTRLCIQQIWASNEAALRRTCSWQPQTKGPFKNGLLDFFKNGSGVFCPFLSFAGFTTAQAQCSFGGFPQAEPWMSWFSVVCLKKQCFELGSTQGGYTTCSDKPTNPYCAGLLQAFLDSSGIVLYLVDSSSTRGGGESESIKQPHFRSRHQAAALQKLWRLCYDSEVKFDVFEYSWHTDMRNQWIL